MIEKLACDRERAGMKVTVGALQRGNIFIHQIRDQRMVDDQDMDVSCHNCLF